MPAPLMGLALKAGGILARRFAKKALKKSAAIGAGIGAASALLPSKKFPGFGGGVDFGKPGKGFIGSSRGRVKAEDGQCPKGYHLNKSKLSDGTEARSVCVRNRRLDVANSRAAKRAGRRLRGLVKLLRKSVTLVVARPKAGKFIAKGK